MGLINKSYPRYHIPATLNMLMICIISVSNFAYNMFKIIESVVTVMS